MGIHEAVEQTSMTTVESSGTVLVFLNGNRYERIGLEDAGIDVHG